MTFESDYDAVLTVKARRDRLDAAIATMAADSEFTPLVRRLGCLRGIGTLTGFALAVEIGDWHRFTGNTIGSFVGLVPSRVLLGRQSRVQGSITKTGNTHVRRLLIEAAWHHRARYVVGKTMRDRWELAGPAARARGDAGQPAAARPLEHLPRTPQAPRGRQRRHRPRARRLVLVPGRARGVTTPQIWLRRPTTVAAARGATRETAMSSRRHPARRSTLDTRSAPAEQPVLR